MIAVSSMQFFLYEATEGVISGVLLQFLVAVGMGYVAGCMYPSNFFPESLQRFGALTPAGAAKSFIGSLAAGGFRTGAFVILVVCFLGFFIGSVLLRKRNVAAEGGAL